MINDPASLAEGQPLLHRYGGYYRFLCVADEDGITKAVYRHVFPFPPGCRIKPLEAFSASFSVIGEEELSRALAGEYGEARVVQERIGAAKSAARATGGV